MREENKTTIKKEKIEVKQVKGEKEEEKYKREYDTKITKENFKFNFETWKKIEMNRYDIIIEKIYGKELKEK